MTSYNRANYITEAIESVLSSTYSNFELIIVDDNSEDQTFSLAKKYASYDSRIKVYKNDSNLGDYPNRNLSITYANGDLLLFVDSDDSIASNSLEYIVTAFAKNNTAQHSAIYYFDDIKEPLLYSSFNAIREHLNGKNILSGGPGSRVFRRNFITSLGGYPEKYGPANDMYFNLQSTASSNILFLPYNYLYYRQHNQQENKNKKGYLFNNYLYFNDAILQLNLPLNKLEKKRLISKNKKRFFVNLLIYMFFTFDIRGGIEVLLKTNLTLIDFRKAIFS